jgi:hypothetical protein
VLFATAVHKEAPYTLRTKLKYEESQAEVIGPEELKPGKTRVIIFQDKVPVISYIDRQIPALSVQQVLS